MHIVFSVHPSCKKYIIEVEGHETIEEIRELLTDSYGLKEGFLLTTSFGELVKTGTCLQAIPGICDMFEIIISIVDQSEMPSPAVIEKPVKNIPVAKSAPKAYSEENLQQLVDMSFNREDAINALTATHDNIEEAINILLPQEAPAAAPAVDQRAAADAEIQAAFDKLTRQEKAAVNRLRKTGQDFSVIVQTFIACGKNEVQARAILAA